MKEKNSKVALILATIFIFAGITFRVAGAPTYLYIGGLCSGIYMIGVHLITATIEDKS